MKKKKKKKEKIEKKRKKRKKKKINCPLRGDGVFPTGRNADTYAPVGGTCGTDPLVTCAGPNSRHSWFSWMLSPFGSSGGPFVLGPGALCSCKALHGWALAAAALGGLAAAVGVLAVGKVGKVGKVGRLLPPRLDLSSPRRPSPPAAAVPWKSRCWTPTPIRKLLESMPSLAAPSSAPFPFWEQPPGPRSWTTKQCLFRLK